MPRPSTDGARIRPRKRFRRLAYLVTVCVAASTALLAPSPAGASGTTFTDAYSNLGSATRADWMKNVASNTWLAALSLPGTHDTLSIHGGPAAQTQEDFGDSANTLTAQLERGIRAIDIRVRVTENKYFVVHHGSAYQNANFDDVLSKAQAFLGQHKGETVVMRLRAECPLSGGGTFDCKNDPDTVDNKRREEIFSSYVSRYPNLFYSPSVTKGKKTGVPQLSQVRGKIVLASFDGLDGDNYGINSFNDHKEDTWNASHPEKKWAYVKANIDRAVSDGSGEMFVTYTSASTVPDLSPAMFAGGYGWHNQQPAVHGVNFRMMQYLNNGGANGHLGVVMMDFPGWALVDNIIARNQGNVVTDGHQAIWQVKADKTYVDTKYNRCMVRGPEFDSSKTGGLVTQRACQSTVPSSHQWGVERPSSYDGKGYYWIKANNGKCLTVPYNNGTPPSAGTQLFWWECETRWFSGSQLWNVIPTPIEVAGERRTAYKFINNWTGLCLSVDPATASTAGGKVTQDTCPK
ncbi:phosphatidylinositol-specific phospholipase C domain-containing protein [Streptomyces sp. ISL-43]|uniref:phosphatidylinositol-specific phospholipase C domain-containing protein n=1 Tax=Streptomyces sp. ISL-43 TaxID=2819183 RepID=UPI001BEB0EAE|nr:phosphatidylinositol-specific phospholipase C domain-containing protein [Streptomyces sp. ISL-43]MBT2449221.1 phosphatidylinositol-specific phospholipase C domain-containing protein [Streptomyces sp. ISL-43]